MKGTRRLLAMLLAVMMVFTAMPMNVFAEETATESSTEESKLFMRSGYWNDSDKMGLESPGWTGTELQIPIEHAAPMFFYYGTETAAEPVPASKLEVSDETVLQLNVVATEDLMDSTLDGYGVDVEALAFGTATITYQGSSVTVKVGLPDLGSYSTETPSQASYLNYKLPLNGSDPAYICLSDEMVAAGYTLGEAILNVDYITVTVNEAKTAAAVTTNNNELEEENTRIRFTLFQNGAEVGTWGNRFSIVDTRPGLKWCWVSTDDNDALYADQENGYENSFEELEGSSYSIAVFYVNGDTVAAIDMDNLTLPTFASAKLMDSSNAQFFNLSLNEPGTGEITCTDYPGVSLPVTSLVRQLGYYDELPASEDSRLGDVSGKITGESGKTVTAYLAWDPDVTGAVEAVNVRRLQVEGESGYAIKNVEMSEAAATLENYGIVLTRNDTDGCVQIVATVGVEMELCLEVQFANNYTENAWLTIAPKSSSSDEDDSFSGNVDLYWVKFRGMDDGAPVYKTGEAKNSMWDEVGQDINAVFLFWDGSAFSEVPFAELQFPSGLNYSQNSEYANAVYMNFDTALEGDITYTKDGVTYEFPLEVEAVTVELDPVAYYNAPERSEDNWNQEEQISGCGDVKTVYLMWDPDLFTLDEKADFKVYMEKNEDEGTELPETVWDDKVDALLEDYGITLQLTYTPKLLLLTDGYYANTRNGYVAAADVYLDGSIQDVDVSLAADTAVADFIDVSSADGAWNHLISYDGEDGDSAATTNIARYTMDEEGVVSLYAATEYLDLEEVAIAEAQTTYSGSVGDSSVRVQATNNTVYYYVSYPDGTCKVNSVVGYTEAPAVAAENITAMYAVGRSLGDNDWVADAIVVETTASVTDQTDLPEEKNWVAVTAAFTAGQTIDFALCVTDNDGTEHEAQISIDGVTPTVQEEDYTALKWRPVEKVDGVYTESTEKLRSFAEIVTQEDILMAFYEVDEEGTATPYAIGRKYPKIAGLFERNDIPDGEDHWAQIVSTGVTHGSVNIASSYSSKLLPWYTDSKEIDEKALNAVELVYALDVMRGYTDGEFKPDETMTRGELAKLMYAIMNSGDDDNAVNYTGADFFSDVEAGDWFEGYVNYCATIGIIQGDSEGKYHPYDSVTVVKAAKTMLQALGYSAEARGYNDADNGAANILADAAAVGLLDTELINTSGNITRQWMAKMLENMLLKCYVTEQISGKYYAVPMGVKYFDLTADSMEYQTIYRAIPLDVVMPFAAFYNTGVRDGDSFAGKELWYDADTPQSYYLLVEDGWTITDIALDPNGTGMDMRFFTWEPVTLDDGSTVVQVDFANTFPRGEWYLIEVTAQNEDNETQSYRTNFTIQTEGAGQLVWRWVKSDADGKLYAAPGDETSAISCRGDDFAMAFFLLENGTETAIPMEDLEFPDFVSVNLMDEDNDYYFEMLFEEFDSGYITYIVDGCVYQMSVECQLPRVDYYSEPKKAEKYYLENMLMGFYGETETAYLVWDPTETGEVEKVTAYFKQSNESAKLDGVEMEAAKDVLAKYKIELTPDLANGYIKIVTGLGIDKNLELTVHFADGRQESAWLNIDNEVTATINEWRRNKENPVITYQGVEYTFGIGRLEDIGRYDIFHAGGGFGSNTSSNTSKMTETVALGAMVNFDTNYKSAAPAWIYECISDVEFEIVDYINAHDLSDQETSNIKIVKTDNSDFGTFSMATADLETTRGGFVEALLRVTFTVTMPGQRPQKCSVDNVVHYAWNRRIRPDMSEIDTAAELNALLSSGDAFVEWIQAQDAAKGTDLYEQYQSAFSVNWEATFELDLPAVTYDDIIVVDLRDVNFNINGTENETTGKRTTMPGMWARDNDCFFLSEIDFVAVDGITQSYNGETFTCGILSYGTSSRGSGDIYTANRCTFTGFDYGVRNTGYGYTCANNRNVFTNCKVGYLIDCDEKQGGNGNSVTEGSRFVNCGTAIRIKGLPTYLAPYDYRIVDCDFIGNVMDIDVSQHGRFYFMRNYFGDTYDGEPPETRADCYYRHARIRGRGYAAVITNPRWLLPCTLGDGDNRLVMDTHHGHYNYMLNHEAHNHRMDSAQFCSDLGSATEPVGVTMTNEEEETLGVWIFASRKQTDAQTLSLLSDTETTETTDEPATFSLALEVEEQEDGSVKVTVEDNDILSTLEPTLSIPCDFVQATVTLNGVEVAATTSGGMVTFTVAQGGSYVIAEKLSEEAIQESFVVNGTASEDQSAPEAEVEVGWFDYNSSEETGEGQSEQSFVQIDTTTENVVQEVNPDDETLGDAEDKVVEAEVVKVEAIYQAPSTSDVVVLLVLYDANGRMLAMHQQEAKQDDGTRVITVQCDKSLIGTDAVQVRAFVISANGSMIPLAPVPFSQTLTIPVK